MSLLSLRKKSIPELGLRKGANAASIKLAFESLHVPLTLDRVTSQFNNMLKLVRAPCGMYLAHFRIQIDGGINQHVRGPTPTSN